jgi:L-malate glycosyltransferase
MSKTCCLKRHWGLLLHRLDTLERLPIESPDQFKGKLYPISMPNHKKKVVIIQSTVRHYRASFFAALHNRLARANVDLRVVYSDPNSHEAKKRDCVELDGQIGAKVPADWMFADHVVYQHAWRHLADAQLVIVEHASKHLLNFALLADRAFSHRKIAFWGHGFNHTGTRLGELVRRMTLRLPDWWFAYTDMTLRYLLASGVPAAITTNVQNAIDTDSFSRAAERVRPEQLSNLRSTLRIPAHARVGLFCGSLYSFKRLPLLIASSELVRASIPDFNLIIVGDGPDRNFVKKAASAHPWIHYAGPKFDDERAPYFRTADLLLNPGLVGLGILDAFAVGLPVLTTEGSIHCPEFDYLEEGRNGIAASPDPIAYARAVVDTLSNPQLLGRLREGACQSGRKYTLSNMVTNFAGGVKACLENKAKFSHPGDSRFWAWH